MKQVEDVTYCVVFCREPAQAPNGTRMQYAAWLLPTQTRHVAVPQNARPPNGRPNASEELILIRVRSDAAPALRGIFLFLRACFEIRNRVTSRPFAIC